MYARTHTYTNTSTLVHTHTYIHTNSQDERTLQDSANQRSFKRRTTATYCNALQHQQSPAQHGPFRFSNTLQRASTRCYALHHTATHCIIGKNSHNMIIGDETRCNTLQHATTHDSAQQHTVTQKMNSTSTHQSRYIYIYVHTHVYTYIYVYIYVYIVK